MSLLFSCKSAGDFSLSLETGNLSLSLEIAFSFGSPKLPQSR
jgi:hypothetical protein